ncbi:chemotaxis protein CheW [bacterium]|nr:chemotaxis protein CheW [bacterium]
MNNNYKIQITHELNSSNTYYIVFFLQGKKYAINIKNVLEIINIPEIEMPEQTPKGIIGMFNYNGTMLKVIDLCPLLGFDSGSFSISNQVIIAISNDNCFAIHTERIENVKQFESENIQTIPYNSDESILNEVYNSENDIINIINIKKLERNISATKETNTINYAQLFPSDEKSKQILKLRANEHKVSQDTFSFPINTNTINQYILFTLNNQNYYLDLKYVKEFISMKRLNITKLPYTQNFIKGIINVRGEFLIVVDLKKFLNENTGTDEKEGKKLIIAEGKNFNIALLVDDIKYIKNLKNISRTSISTENSGYIYAEIMEDNVLYSILNFEKIINDEKMYVNVN